VKDAPNALTSAETAAAIALIARRELAAYFDSSIAYVYTIGFVVLANSIFMNDFFLTGTADMTAFFDLLPQLLAIFLPAVTMRLWAEERKHRTIELLLTLPIWPREAVAGKYVAALALYALFLAGSLPIVVMLLVLGDPDAGLIASGYMGVFLLGAQLIAAGMFFSALSSDQIVAFVTGSLAAFAFVLSGNDRVVEVLDGLAPSLAPGTVLYESVSVMPHFDAFVRGSVQLPSVLYFCGMSAIFLWMTALVLRQDRT
jgi:ABC-type transport system involved in multi-copper enzyme maturation permease subunit